MSCSCHASPGDSHMIMSGMLVRAFELNAQSRPIWVRLKLFFGLQKIPHTME